MRPHLFNTYIATNTLTFYDNKRLENNQDQFKHVTWVISFAENIYNESWVEGIPFLGMNNLLLKYRFGLH